MTTLRVEVQRFSIVSSSSFNQVVAKLVAAFGHPDSGAGASLSTIRSS